MNKTKRKIFETSMELFFLYVYKVTTIDNITLVGGVAI